MPIRRYRLRLIAAGENLLADRLILAALDLESGHGLAAARVQLDRELIGLARSARVHESDLWRCHLEVVDEASGQVVYDHYPTGCA